MTELEGGEPTGTPDVPQVLDSSTPEPTEPTQPESNFWREHADIQKKAGNHENRGQIRYYFAEKLREAGVLLKGGKTEEHQK